MRLDFETRGKLRAQFRMVLRRQSTRKGIKIVTDIFEMMNNSMKVIYFSKQQRELATLNIFNASLERGTNSYQSVDKRSFQSSQPSLNS